MRRECRRAEQEAQTLDNRQPRQPPPGQMTLGNYPGEVAFSRGDDMIGEFCIVRTYSAGVHCGVLDECSGTAVVLKDARRIWRWSKAFSLNEMSLKGCGEDSRISQPVARIMLTQAVEIIPCTDKARENLSRSRNGA